MTGTDSARGFSTSASALVIFVGMFGALTGLYVAASNTTEQVQDAGSEQLEQQERVADTAINVTEARLVDDTAPCELSLQVNNTGSTTLLLDDTDLLLDGEYQTGWEDGATVDGNADTETWRPSETLTITIGGLATVPGRATVVTRTGVAAVRDVDGGLVCS